MLPLGTQAPDFSLVNVDMNKAHKITLDFQKMKQNKTTANILTSAKVQDHNSFENPNKIVVKEYEDFKFKKGILELEVPAFSVIVFEIK